MSEPRPRDQRCSRLILWRGQCGISQGVSAPCSLFSHYQCELCIPQSHTPPCNASRNQFPSHFLYGNNTVFVLFFQAMKYSSIFPLYIDLMSNYQSPPPFPSDFGRQRYNFSNNKLSFFANFYVLKYKKGLQFPASPFPSIEKTTIPQYSFHR